MKRRISIPNIGEMEFETITKMSFGTTPDNKFVGMKIEVNHNETIADEWWSH